MANQELLFKPAREIASELRARTISAVELVELLLDRIAETDNSVKAYTTVSVDDARRQAAHADRELLQGHDRGPLHGLPVSIKDLIDVEGVTTTYGSAIFKDHVPAADATVVTRLRQAGAVIVGKTNTHEFALGGVTPPTRNPFDLDRIPGGSSGGSAAAIAAGSALLSLGSDTGGSIRIPASYCGVIGLKPTYGLVSRTGVFPESWSLDHIGPITRHVDDAAMLLSAIAGHDPSDHTTPQTTPTPGQYSATIGQGAHGLTVGIPTNHFFDDLEPEVDNSVRGAISHLETQGATIEEVALPDLPEILGAHTAIDLAEITTNHRRLYAHHANEYRSDSKRFIESGFYVHVTTYIDALRARPRLLTHTLEAMRHVDMVATPSQPIAAPRIGEETATINGVQQDLLFAMVRLLAPFNLTGLPALSICCGHTPGRLPIGLQLVGKPYQEATLLSAAHSYQTSTPWLETLTRPPL
jgi:aspartyl-tRNA(Asn)/glutamyl-tRNA(Gln) amidotransferase subunit A